MLKFLHEFADDFKRHPLVASFSALVPARLASWARESPTVALPVTLAVLLVSFVIVSRALGLGLPDERGFEKGTKVETIKYRPPPAGKQSTSTSSGERHQSGEQGAPSFAEAVAGGAHPASG